MALRPVRISKNQLKLFKNRKDFLNICMRSRDYVCSYKLSKSGCCCASALYCRFNCSYISTNHNCYKTGTDLLCSYQSNVSCLHIWSAASIAAVSPLVSTIPNASCVMIISSLWIVNALFVLFTSDFFGAAVYFSLLFLLSSAVSGFSCCFFFHRLALSSTSLTISS